MITTKDNTAPITDIAYTHTSRHFGTKKIWYATVGEFEGAGPTRKAATAALFAAVAAHRTEDPRLVVYRTATGLVYRNHWIYAYTLQTTDTSCSPARCLLPSTDDMDAAERALRRHIAQQCMTAEDAADDAITHAGDRAEHLRYWREVYNHKAT